MGGGGGGSAQQQVEARGGTGSMQLAALALWTREIRPRRRWLELRGSKRAGCGEIQCVEVDVRA